MNDLTIIQLDGSAYIDSREVAKIIDKQHGHLMRDIRGYIKIMDKITQSNFGVSDFFLENSYVDSTGRELPCYLLSKMGCEMVANKLTGEKGVLFTAAYVAKFNEMEIAVLDQLEAKYEELIKEVKSLSFTPLPRLGEFNACARIVVRALRDIGSSSEQIIVFLKGVYKPLGIKIVDDEEIGNTPKMYTAKQIAKKLGIYSENGNPHYQAVACILNENLFINENHKTVETNDYGNHVGICVRYDEYALNSVTDWLVEYGYPNEIYGFGRTFRVQYCNSNKSK